MTIAVTGIGFLEISGTSEDFDAAVPSPLKIVRDDQSIPRIYIAEVRKTGYRWARSFTQSGSGFNKHDVVYGRNGVWLACGDSGKVYRTLDEGENWEHVSTIAHLNRLLDIVYRNGTWVVGSNQYVNWSLDNGDTWAYASAGMSGTTVKDVAVNDSVFVIARSNSYASSVVEYSSAGDSWSTATIPASTRYEQIIFDSYSSTFYAVGHRSVNGSTTAAVGKSTDGITWASVRVSTTAAISSASLDRISTNNNGMLVAGNNLYTAWASTDSDTNWTQIATASSPTGHFQILWHQLSEEFYALGYSHLYESEDGKEWTRVETLGDTIAKSAFNINTDTGLLMAAGGSQGSISRMQPSPIRVATNRYVGNGFVYEGRLKNPANFSMQTSTYPTVGGESKSSFGTIDILNGDGRYDDRLADAWDNGTVYVKYGTEDLAHDDFGLVYEGLVQEAVWDEDTISFSIKNKQSLLDTPVQQNVYSSSYSSSLWNKPKPLGYGVVLNATPVVVSAIASAVFQIHEGAVNSFDHVYIAGVSTALYTTNVSAGTFQLDVDPGNDAVTVDFKGDAVDGYSAKLTDVVTSILLNKAGLTSSDLDSVSISETESIFNPEIGLYLDDERTYKNILDQLALSVGFVWGFNRNNKFFMKLISEPGTPFRSYSSDSKILSIRRVRSNPVVWTVHTGYEQNWTVQENNTLAGSVDNERQLFLSEEYRKIQVQSSAVKSSHSAARELHINSLLAYSSSCQYVVNKYSSVYSLGRDVYEVTVQELTHDLEIGQSISISYPRFGLSSGKSFILVKFVENIRAGVVTLTLWG